MLYKYAGAHVGYDRGEGLVGLTKFISQFVKNDQI